METRQEERFALDIEDIQALFDWIYDTRNKPSRTKVNSLYMKFVHGVEFDPFGDCKELIEKKKRDWVNLKELLGDAP